MLDVPVKEPARGIAVSITHTPSLDTLEGRRWKYARGSCRTVVAAVLADTQADGRTLSVEVFEKDVLDNTPMHIGDVSRLVGDETIGRSTGELLTIRRPWAGIRSRNHLVATARRPMF